MKLVMNPLGASGGPAPFTSDSFTGPDSTALTAHIGEIGAAWTVHPSENAAPAPVIVSDELRRSDSGADTCSYYASGAQASPDYSVSVDFDVFGDVSHGGLWFTGVWGRLSTGVLTGYLMDYVANNGTIYVSLTKVVNGAFTDLDTFPIAPSAHTATLTMVGDQISVSVDGTVVMSETDGAIVAPGRTGVRIGANGSSQTSGIAVDKLVAGPS